MAKQFPLENILILVSGTIPKGKKSQDTVEPIIRYMNGLETEPLETVFQFWMDSTRALIAQYPWLEQFTSSNPETAGARPSLRELIKEHGAQLSVEALDK